MSERKITHYILLHGGDCDISNHICHNLKGGWELYGEMIIKGDGPWDFFQAMVKYEQSVK